jgi:hypothetical protein
MSAGILPGIGGLPAWDIVANTAVASRSRWSGACGYAGQRVFMMVLLARAQSARLSYLSISDMKLALSAHRAHTLFIDIRPDELAPRAFCALVHFPDIE